MTYLSNVFVVERDAIKNSAGLEVDDVTITAYAKAEALIQGVTLPVFVNNGGFDNAWLKIERARNTYVVHLFEGMITDAEADRTKINLTVSAATILLNVLMPRNTYNAGCVHTLFDTGCGLSKSAFANSTTITSSPSVYVLSCGLTQANGYFDLGTVRFNSGVNNGVTCTIKYYTTGVIVLAYPLPHLPSIDDTFTAYPGCDKTRVTCNNIFANQAKFRGFPFMPVPEASI